MCTFTEFYGTLYNVAAKGVSKASCSKCGISHVRPVGVRCKRVLNIIALPIRDNHSSDEELHAVDNQTPSQSDVQDQVAAPSLSGANAATPPLSQMESKLDLILKKVQSLEQRTRKRRRRWSHTGHVSQLVRFCIFHQSGHTNAPSTATTTQLRWTS